MFDGFLPADPLKMPEVRLRLWWEIALLSRAAMEGIWEAMWYTAFFAGLAVRSWAGVWAVFFVLVAVTYAGTREMAFRGWSLRRRRWVMLAWVLAVTWISLKLIFFPTQPVPLLDLLSAPLRFIADPSAPIYPFAHSFVVLLLVMRGVFLADDQPDLRSGLLNFQLGLVAILFYGMSFAPLEPRLSAAGLFAYLLAGLVMLGSARIVAVTAARGGRIPRLGPGWIGGVLAGAAGVVLLGLLLGRLAATNLITVLARILLGLLGILSALFLLLLLPVFSALRGLITLLMNAISDLAQMEFLKNLSKMMQNINQTVGQQVATTLAPLVTAGRILIPIAILAGTVAAILLFLRLRNLGLSAQAEEGAQHTPGDSLLDLLRALTAGQGTRRRATAGQILAAARIRRIYARLMLLSARLGAPRRASLTPLEFLPTLETTFEGQSPALEAITSAYLRVRYGEFPESNREVEEIAAAWKQVEAQGRRLARRRRNHRVREG